MSHPRSLLAALCLLSVVGCAGEESMQEKMLRVARERSEIRKQREAEDLAQAKLAATKQNESEADKPVAKGAANDASSNEKTASRPSTKPSSNSTKPGPAPPPKSELAANADRPETVAEPVSPAEAETTLPHPDDLMTFGRLGKQVAFVGESQSIGVYDVQSKRLH